MYTTPSGVELRHKYLFPLADATLDDGKLVIKTLEPQHMISEGWVPLQP